MRETTISVSEEEKKELDAASEALFGTDEVPYGATISRLCRQYTGTESG